MDLQTIAIVLKAALSPNPAERKAAEDSLNKFQYNIQHLVRLLEIIVDGNCNLAVRQVASIHFKNFRAENWSPHDPGEQSKISPSDKELVRQNILVFVAQVPALLRAQLGECLKTIIHADYPEQWPGLVQWVTHNLQDQQVYGALFVLRILSRKYKLPHLFAHVEPTLLPIMRRMLTTDGQDILVPMDNYVSRSTVHYLTCKEPDYQQSLWIMLSNVMSNKNLEGNDIEPANAHHANTHLPKTSHPNKKTQFQFNKPKMKVGYHCKAQICSLLLIFVFLFGFNLELSLGQHQCQHSHDHEHDHYHHEHHHHYDHDLSVKKLPEELAEEEDLRMEFASHHHHHHHHHDHGSGSELLTGVGLWINAMGCSLLVSLASLICLILLPLIFFQGKPSKAFVDALAVFGAGAMLGDAFLHQLPHAFGGGHSHPHDDLAHDHDHAPSHSHSIEDLSVGLSILFGIIVFLLVEKAVRYVEERSGGDSLWGHGHHHHHQKKSESLQDVSGDDFINKQTTRDEGKVSETTTRDEPSLLRKRNTSRNGVGDEIDSAVENGPESNTKSIIEKEPVRPSSLVFGYLNLFSDGVHNFTDGMALGSAFLLYGSVGGWSRTLFLLAHELPQEIGDFGILVRSGFSVFKALFFNFLSALVALAGTALALSLGQDPGQSSLIEGFTAGGFIYIAVGVMAEMNNGSSSLKSSAIQLTSLVMGMSVALFISLIE